MNEQAKAIYDQLAKVHNALLDKDINGEFPADQYVVEIEGVYIDFDRQDKVASVDNATRFTDIARARKYAAMVVNGNGRRGKAVPLRDAVRSEIINSCKLLRRLQVVNA